MHGARISCIISTTQIVGKISIINKNSIVGMPSEWLIDNDHYLFICQNNSERRNPSI